MTDAVDEVGRRVARVAARKDVMSEIEFMHAWNAGRAQSQAAKGTLMTDEKTTTTETDKKTTVEPARPPEITVTPAAPETTSETETTTTTEKES